MCVLQLKCKTVSIATVLCYKRMLQDDGFVHILDTSELFSLQAPKIQHFLDHCDLQSRVVLVQHFENVLQQMLLLWT